MLDNKRVTKTGNGITDFIHILNPNLTPAESALLARHLEAAQQRLKVKVKGSTKRQRRAMAKAKRVAAAIARQSMTGVSA